MKGNIVISLFLIPKINSVKYSLFFYILFQYFLFFYSRFSIFPILHLSNQNIPYSLFLKFHSNIPLNPPNIALYDPLPITVLTWCTTIRSLKKAGNGSIAVNQSLRKVALKVDKIVTSARHLASIDLACSQTVFFQVQDNLGLEE